MLAPSAILCSAMQGLNYPKVEILVHVIAREWTSATDWAKIYMVHESSVMSKIKKISVRPVEQTSVIDKKFQRVMNTTKRVKIKTSHPAIVLADLKKGSLTSLARYIRETGNIADREVCQQLLMLIDGSYDQTSFRILVARHPDEPLDVGGRPRSKTGSLTIKQEKILLRYDEKIAVEKKYENAIPIVMRDENVSKATIDRAIRARKKLLKQVEKDALQRLKVNNLEMSWESLLAMIVEKFAKT